MSPSVTDDRTHETHYYQRYLDLEGTSPILLERNYSHGGKEFIPEYAYARWSHGKNIEEITLTGPVLKKDGSVGQQITDLDCITPHHRYWSDTKRWHNKAPEWLLEMFGIEVPEEQ